MLDEAQALGVAIAGIAIIGFDLYIGVRYARKERYFPGSVSNYSYALRTGRDFVPTYTSNTIGVYTKFLLTVQVC